MAIIAKWIASIVKDVANESLQEKILGEVNELCGKFPVYK